MTSIMKIALLQMDIAIGQPEMNFKKCTDMIEEAMNVSELEKPDLIMLPELWNTGYALKEIQELADPEGSRTKSIISELCRKFQVHIIAGSVAVRTGNEVRNTSYVFNREGQVVSEYSKTHLFRLMDEEQYLVSGDKVGDMELAGSKAGLMICYDIRFPELTRKLALNGAKVLFVPAEWPKPRLQHWRTLLLARAIENQMFVVACNRVGISGETGFFGHSMIIDPWGDVIVEGGEDECILRGAIDIHQVEKVRSMIPIFEDRRPSLY